MHPFVFAEIMVMHGRELLIVSIWALEQSKLNIQAEIKGNQIKQPTAAPDCAQASPGPPS